MIPSKLPEGTTKEQWEQYEADVKEHEARCEREKPLPENYTDMAGGELAYMAAFRAWQMMRSCDAPNKPGYYRANND